MTFLRIVVPVLNEGRALGGRLSALCALRQRGAELAVVDGGSTDETWAVARVHADCLLSAPRGRGAQMNAGADGSHAEVLLFLHADTTLPLRADDLIRQALSRGRLWGRFDVRIDGRHPLLRAVEHLINLRSRLSGIATGDQAIFIRRETFERIGGFADIPLMEDVDITARLRRLGRPACITSPVITSGRRWERHGVARIILLMWSLRARYALGVHPQTLADRYGYPRRPSVRPAGVAILAKAPVAGVAKTRLIPALRPAGAARAQRSFTLATVESAQRSGLEPVTLWGAPDATHRFFRAIRQTARISLIGQCSGDLGQRMKHAMEQHFRAHPSTPLLVIGTDCPMLSPGHLNEAALALARHDVVLIPAEDGGYVLIGMARALPTLFENIAWSTDQVLQQTRDRLRGAGLQWHEFSPLWDVDQPADWHRLRRLLEVQRGFDQ